MKIEFSSIEELLLKVKPFVEKLVSNNLNERSCIIIIGTEKKVFQLVKGKEINQALSMAEVIERNETLQKTIELIKRSEYER